MGRARPAGNHLAAALRVTRARPDNSAHFTSDRPGRRCSGGTLSGGVAGGQACGGTEDDMPQVTVIGGGLAGSEAAWRLATGGVAVELVEMKPSRRSPAHVLDGLAELVCSNSLRSDNPQNAVGLLHEELRRLS